MEKNVFEGAKFGDKFVTRNGLKAILLYYVPKENICLCCEDGYMDNQYQLDGTLPYENNSGEYDIVSRYQEPINEEKLDELATDWDDWDDNADKSQWYYTKTDLERAYKAGYRKAMRE